MWRRPVAVAVTLAAFAGAAEAQGRLAPDICGEPVEIIRSRITVERAGLPGPDKSRLTRTLRAAQTLLEDGCPQRDAWLIRRAVGMVNAVNREIRRAPIDPPLWLRD